MEPERWRQIEDLFQAALDCEPERRSALLEAACGHDRALREEVDSLLASYEEAGFTEAPAFRDAVRLLEQNHSLTGKRIGPYRVIREIGHGGMGAVYLAARADEAFRKQVAIKLIKRGLHMEAIVQRFRNERQILASLDHPNITRLLDGGTTEDGLPYFVMEYIQGEPIDSYCDARKLNIVDRLRLFQRVCAAVHYAQQNLVVHRDIKPGNVLVTVEGVPRLLDFGIAKLLSPERSQETSAGALTAARLMTPRYASPEQVRGEPVTTASDVYSLGVLLYELLTGHSPYRLSGRTPAEVDRAICHDEPEKPSEAISRVEEAVTPQSVSATREGTPDKLRRRLLGDLDNIVLMAMHKEPQRRYGSVEKFSEDIDRHLEGLPVRAHADSWRYRAGKFVSRHRAGVAAAILVALSLLAGMVATAWQARVALRERAKAERQFNDVRGLTTSFLFEFHGAIENLPGATPARKLLVQRALEYLSKLAEEAHSNRRLQLELAEAYLKVGDVQGNPYEPNLGDTQGAAKSYRKALEISQALTRTVPRDAEARRYLARSYKSVGEVLPVLGNPSEALVNFQQAAGTLESLTAADRANAQLRLELAACYQETGDLQGQPGIQNLGDQAGALGSYAKALEIYQALAADDTGNSTARRGVAVVKIRIGDLQSARDELQGSQQSYRDALEIMEQLSAADPTSAKERRLLAHAYRKMGGAMERLSNLKEALKYYLKAVAINEGLMSSDPANVQAGMSLAISLRSSAGLLLKMGNRQGALGNYQRVLNILEALSTAHPEDVWVQGRYSKTLLTAADLLAQSGKPVEARRLTSRGLGIARELAGRSDATPDDMSQYAATLLTCQPDDLCDPGAALLYAKKSVAKSGGANSDHLDVLAQAYFQNGEVTQAIETEEKALKLLPPPQPHQPDPPAWRRIKTQLARFKAAQRHKWKPAQAAQAGH